MAPANLTPWLPIFLILEMDRPLDGFIKIPAAPLHAALAQLGQQL